MRRRLVSYILLVFLCAASCACRQGAEHDSEDIQSETSIKEGPILMPSDLSPEETVKIFITEEFPEVDVTECNCTEWLESILQEMPEINSQIESCYAAGQKTEDGQDFLIICIGYKEDDDRMGFPKAENMVDALSQKIEEISGEEKLTTGQMMSSNKMAYVVGTNGYKFKPWMTSGWAGVGDFRSENDMPPYH